MELSNTAKVEYYIINPDGTKLAITKNSNTTKTNIYSNTVYKPFSMTYYTPNDNSFSAPPLINNLDYILLWALYLKFFTL